MESDYYTLHGVDGLEERTVSYDWLRRAVARRAEYGEALTYFLDSIGPRVAPRTFDLNLSTFEEYVACRHDCYSRAFPDREDALNLSLAVMDAVDFAACFERSIASRLS